MSSLRPDRWTPQLRGPGVIQTAIRSAQAAGHPWILLIDHRDVAAQAERQQRRAFTRLVVQSIAADFYGIHPSDLSTSTNSHGKPILSPVGGHPALHLNISHSQHVSIAGFCLEGPIGVDIETVRPVATWQSISSRYFEPDAQQRLQIQPPAVNPYPFIAEWCRMESRWKAVGTGIQSNRRRSPAEQAALERLCHWSLELPDGYCGAVAVATAP